MISPVFLGKTFLIIRCENLIVDFEMLDDKLRNKLRKVDESSLLERIRDVKRRNINDIDLRQQDYKSLVEVIKDMDEVQQRFESLVKSESSTIYKTVNNYKNLFYEKVLGKKTKCASLEELFESQLTNLSNMNSYLDNILVNSKAELKLLQRNVDSVSHINETNHNNRQAMKSLIPEDLEEYEELQTRLSKMTERSPDYFEIKRKARMLERQISEFENNYLVSTDKMQHYQEEEQYLELMEKMLTVSINTAERISVKERLIEDTLWKTKTTYQAIGDVIKATAAITNGIELLAEYTNEVHNTLTTGLKQMNNILTTNYEVNNTLHRKSEINKLVENLERTNYKSGLLSEQRVDKKC